MNQYDVMITKLRHYDTTYEYDMSMYDNLPYNRDRERCNEESVGLQTGNVYSCYRYNFVYSEAPYVYTAPDMVFTQGEEYYVVDNNSNYTEEVEDNTDYSTNDFDDSSYISNEQIDSLLSDNEDELAS